MFRVLNPKLDIVFKLLFMKGPDLLIDLLNEVMDFSAAHHIETVEIKNPIILPEEPAKKYIVLDVLAVDNFSRQYDIEMQVLRFSFYSKRSMFYLSKMYAGQLDSGEHYRHLRPVIGIHFLNYEEFPDHPDFHFCFEFRDYRYPALRFIDDFALHVFELPKFERRLQNMTPATKLEEWLHFFNHAPEETTDEQRRQYANPTIRKAFTLLDELSADEETRYIVEMREKALKDEASIVAELTEAQEKLTEAQEKLTEAQGKLTEAQEIGRKEGRAEGKVEGLEEGLLKGELIGDIRLLQYQLEMSISSKEALSEKPLKELNALYRELIERQRREKPETHS